MMNYVYDYEEAMQDDIREYLKDNFDPLEYDDADDAIRQLIDDLWDNDNVTGNGSGSYTFNNFEAMEYVVPNIDLYLEACAEFGNDLDNMAKTFSWEGADVTIRCYLLYRVLDDMRDEIEEMIIKAHEENEEEEE